MKAAPNRYHCASSQAFDDQSNSLREVALPALIRIEPRISQITALPIRAFTASMTRLIFSSPCMALPDKGFPVRDSQLVALRTRLCSFAARFKRFGGQGGRPAYFLSCQPVG